MRRISQFLKEHLNNRPEAAVPSILTDGPFPTEADFYRYRKQRGVNLGSWFVLERWIADGPFRAADSPAQSDLDVVRGTNAKAILEQHWDTWITQDDWEWIAQRGINTVRIPIGYYHICGADPSVLHNTDFANYGKVFEGAWRRITNAIAIAHQYGLGVLIDLHAAPGKQNADSHSGTSSPNPTFFTNEYNMKHTIHVLSVLLSQLTAFTQSHDPPLPNIVGIELLNEPQPQTRHHALEKWYLEAFRTLRAIDTEMPLYIGDVWMTDQYVDFLSGSATQFAVLDHHLYRCFTTQDISTPVAEHTRALTDPDQWAPQMFARVGQKLESAGCGIVIGEWSGGLNPGSLQDIEDGDQARRQYVEAQLQLYDRCCAGWFFWTYKKERGGDTGWSLKDAVQARAFPAWVGMRAIKPIGDAQNRDRDASKDSARSRALGRYPGRK
ncbi:glycoside hydrolase family 5 protein [Wolfiporia cocos MD-104 SS10]|uniref:Glycoside hydrolase family 5 protein n=1 Tax=Wolfiporia cocos (strain MD-104) TaxID=742152 RepID=A0A2H3J8F7_WOLCO|nr:glycoside hydrolase family 5 protein [Wolfiporia cocos MD-104 SS10]